MNSRRTCAGLLLIIAFLLLMMVVSPARAARCQIASVSYSYPRQASANQQITIDTIVAGSCVSNGMDYYSARADLVDENSNGHVSTNSTPIGYYANNFNVTVPNTVITPNSNGTWPIQIHLYVIRAGGTDGPTLLDYQTVGNVTIQLGATPVPEFRTGLSFTIVFMFTATAVVVMLRRRRANT